MSTPKHIPADLFVISNGLFPSDLTEPQFSDIIYASWYKVTDVRKGECLAVSASEIKGLESIKNFGSIEDNGFAFKDISIELIDGPDKRWNEVKGFFI